MGTSSPHTIVALFPEFSGTNEPVSYVAVIDTLRLRDRYAAVSIRRPEDREWNYAYVYTNDLAEALRRAYWASGIVALVDALKAEQR